MNVARNSDTLNAGPVSRAMLWLGRSPFAGVLVLCVSLAFTVTLWRAERGDIEHHRQLRFEKVTDRITAQLQDRMQAYEDLLQGASGLFAVVPGVGAEPNPGGGSTFWFRVRVRASAQPARHIHWNAPEPLAQDQGEGCASRTPALGPEERERLRAACAEISALLREGDLDACNLLQAHAPLLQSALPAHAPRIVEAVESFDFDTALATLEGGCREAGLDLS